MKVLATTLALALGILPSAVLADGSRYIVKFNEGRAQGAMNALHAAGAQVVLSLDAQNAVAAHIPDQALAGLEHNPNIEYIEVDAPRFPMAASNRALASGETLPYGIAMVQADLVSSANEGNRKICIIDSGYSQQHADLKDSVTNSTTTGTGTWNKDSCGHGSHVAGTIAATAGGATPVGVVGVIPGVQLHIVKVFGDDNLVDGGNCAWTYSSTLVAALTSCKGAGANVVSMSLGGGLKSRTEENAFNDAYNKSNMLSIAAAGNDGTKTTSYPAGYDSVISVAAVDANETVASFSQQNRDVELAAPGVAVLSTVPWTDIDSLGFASGGSVSGGHVEFSARTAGITAALVDGGQCTAAGAWTGKVVVCQRGTNSFLQKVQAVQSGGGVAAVIYNNVTSDATCGPFAGTLGDGNSSTIPAITLSCADGTAAVNHAGGNGTVVSQFVAPSSGYEAWDGTSMATPHVSGVAALVWSCNPNLSNAQIRSALTSSAKDKGGVGRDNAYGFGIVQAKAAVGKLSSAPNCTVLSTSKYP